MLHILHLEDSGTDHDLIKLVLEGQGVEHELHWAQNRAMFVNILERIPVDVVLCDSAGPGFVGKEVLALVRSQEPNAVFIFLTGHTGGPVWHALERSGADGVLSKDEFPMVWEAIARALRAKRLATGAEKNYVMNTFKAP